MSTAGQLIVSTNIDIRSMGPVEEEDMVSLACSLLVSICLVVKSKSCILIG